LKNGAFLARTAPSTGTLCDTISQPLKKEHFTKNIDE
jgi:hypothetical protein